MKKETQRVVLLVALVLVSVALGLFIGTQLAPQEETVKYVEVVSDSTQMYDVSALECWGGYENGTIRMIGAWYYGTGKDGAMIVEDESGELWTLTDVTVTDTQFLLLWINDNSTEDTKDDTIVKVWSEVYE